MARGKGEGSVYKQSDGLWAASVTLPDGIDGKRRRKVVRSKSKKTVLLKLNEIQKDLAKHGNLPTSNLTLGSWVTHWIEKIAPNEVRPKTLAGYRSSVNNYLIPILGNKKLSSVSAQDVRAMHARILATPKSMKIRKLPESEWPEDVVFLKGDTAVLVHTALSVALDVAHKEGRVSVNVAEVAGRPSKAKSVQHSLTADEAMRLLAHVATRSDAALWTTYILTGARRGEVLGLEADRVGETLDLSWQLQRVSNIEGVPADFEYRHLQGTMYLTRPKSSAGWRIIPLVEPLKSVIDLHMQDRGSGLVFKFLEDRPWDPDTATKTWARILKEAKLPSNVTLHGARNTVVDLLYAAEVPEATIMQVVGHSTLAMTRHYRTRVDQKLASDAMEKLSDQLR